LDSSLLHNCLLARISSFTLTYRNSPIMRYAVGLLLLLVPVVYGQRDAKIPDPDPEVERKSFKVAEGFEVTLFAADPLLAKPLQINFDAQGRLWVVSSETYPQIKPGQKADDKVLILEDTKGTGKADKVTVFADGLLIPSGLEPGDGGVYVANSTELIHLSASKPGGKADRKKVILSGFGTEDTHHMLHTLRWGHDGNLYMNQSVYIHSSIETPHGPRRLNGGGIWKFRPETLELEVFTRGMVNSWGHHFDRWGQSFATDGAGSQGVNPQIPGGAYFWASGVSRTLSGVNPGSPKYCGCEIVSGRHLPEDWQGDLITCDFRANRVVRYKLAPNGAGYTARLMPDVIKASHPAFRPVDVKMGPDGAIYIADWYNPIIQHGEVDFRDPRRDQTRGRIWRITAKGRKLAPKTELAKAKPAELLAALESEEGFTRHFARRELLTRDRKDTLAALKEFVSKTEAKKESLLLEALWCYQTLREVEPTLLSKLLTATDYRVRAAAVRVVDGWADQLPNVLALLEPRLADDHPQVRLEAVCALRRVESPRAAELALRVLERPMDQYLDYSLWLTLRELESQWLPALQAGTFKAESRGLAFALEAVGSNKVIGPLVSLLRSGKTTPETEGSLLGVLARVAGPNELSMVLNAAADDKRPAAQRVALLTALADAARDRGVAPADRKPLAALLANPDVEIQALRLAGLWKTEEMRGTFSALARDDKATPEQRSAAIAGLGDLGGKESVVVLGTIIDAKGDIAMRRAAFVALARFDLNAAASRAPALLADEKPESVQDLFDAFTTRKGGAATLAKALTGQKLPADVARVGVRTLRGSGRPDDGLIEALSKAGGLTEGTRKVDAKEVEALTAEVRSRGDAIRGEAIYRRGDMQCLKCHAIGGAGGAVGPDMSSIGASAQIDYLVESLLLPSKAIKEGYHSVLVTTKRGEQFTGVKIRETKEAITLRTDQDKEVVIAMRRVENIMPSKVSLMPEGLTDTLTRNELVDLVAFLSSLGKTERFSVGRDRPARRWQVLVPTKEVSFLLGRKGVVGLLDDASLTWEPAYSTVHGDLPLEGLSTFKTFGKDGATLTLLRAELDSTADVKAVLKMADEAGLTLWLDGEPLTPAKAMKVTLKAGSHVIHVLIDRGARKTPVRLEIDDTPGSAVLRFVGGK
jgi:putative heme-binding domain-containing protein